MESNFGEKKVTCEKCKDSGMIKEKDGTCHTCWDCMAAGRLNQHSDTLPENTRIKL